MVPAAPATVPTAPAIAVRVVPGPGGPGPRGFGPSAAALAKALGVPQAKVTAALAKLRATMEKREAARRDAFAAELAKRLGISEEKVKAAFASLPHHGPGDRP